MPDEQTSSQSTFAEPSRTAEEHGLLPEGGDGWHEDDELPRRPRRTLLTPLPLSLLAILLVAGGFIGGVLVQKGQSSTGVGTGGAARFAALRSGAASGAPPSATGGIGSPAAPNAEGTSNASGRAAGAGVAVGQVAFVKGSTLYVTDTQGNTVKVESSAAATVTKTVSSSVKAIHPGETVLVTGSTGAGGSISARSIRVGAASAGGLGGLFSGSGPASNSGSGPAAGASETGEPALFGRG